MASAMSMQAPTGTTYFTEFDLCGLDFGNAVSELAEMELASKYPANPLLGRFFILEDMFQLCTQDYESDNQRYGGLFIALIVAR
jgi:hypothetical protein